jgi:hypothetical protein
MRMFPASGGAAAAPHVAEYWRRKTHIALNRYKVGSRPVDREVARPRTIRHRLHREPHLYSITRPQPQRLRLSRPINGRRLFVEIFGFVSGAFVT